MHENFLCACLIFVTWPRSENEMCEHLLREKKATRKFSTKLPIPRECNTGDFHWCSVRLPATVSL